MRYVSLFFLGVTFFCACSKDDILKNYNIEPVLFSNVTVDDDFWTRFIRENYKSIIYSIIENEKEIYSNNSLFEKIKVDTLNNRANCLDRNIFNFIQKASCYFSVIPDKKLESYIDSLILIIDKQYKREILELAGKAINLNEKKDPENEQLFIYYLSYFGSLYNSSVVYYSVTNNSKLLKIALESADFFCEKFAVAEIIPLSMPIDFIKGMVELYRVTGNEKYIQFVKSCFVFEGNRNELLEYCKNKGLYCESVMAQIAMVTNNKKYKKILKEKWKNVVNYKMNVVGQISREDNDITVNKKAKNNYCELNSVITNIDWNYYMFLMSGDGKYMEVLERILYNDLLDKVLALKESIHPKVYEIDDERLRQDKKNSVLCMPQTTFLPITKFIYAQKKNDLYTNLFISGDVKFETKKGDFILRQESNMPWNGYVTLSVETKRKIKARLYLRIPGWASRKQWKGSKYKFRVDENDNVVVKVNGEKRFLKIKNGYAVISKKWQSGDKIELELPYRIRKIEKINCVSNNCNEMALQLGPFIYCSNFEDYRKADSITLRLDWNMNLSYGYYPGKLNGVNVVMAESNEKNKMDNMDTFTAIPFYAREKRENDDIKVWLYAR